MNNPNPLAAAHYRDRMFGPRRAAPVPPVEDTTAVISSTNTRAPEDADGSLRPQKEENNVNLLALLPSEVLKSPTISPFSFLDWKSILIVSTLNKQNRAIVRGPGFEDLFRPPLFLSASKERGNNHGRSVQLLQQLYQNRDKLQKCVDVTLTDFNKFLDGDFPDRWDLLNNFRLEGVESLTLSSNSPLTDKQCNMELLYCFQFIMPNIQNITVIDADVGSEYLKFFLGQGRQWHLLSKITWRGIGMSDHVTIYGSDFWLEHLREMDMDDSCFEMHLRRARRERWLGGSVFPSTPAAAAVVVRPSPCIFHRFSKQLERFSIRNATCFADDDTKRTIPISQQELIRFVRNAPSLKWFRSDLTLDNIAMLKQERPDIEFVS